MVIMRFIIGIGIGHINITQGLLPNGTNQIAGFYPTAL